MLKSAGKTRSPQAIARNAALAEEQLAALAVFRRLTVKLAERLERIVDGCAQPSDATLLRKTDGVVDALGSLSRTICRILERERWVVENYADTDADILAAGHQTVETRILAELDRFAAATAGGVSGRHPGDGANGSLGGMGGSGLAVIRPS